MQVHARARALSPAAALAAVVVLAVAINELLLAAAHDLACRPHMSSNHAGRRRQALSASPPIRTPRGHAATPQQIECTQRAPVARALAISMMLTLENAQQLPQGVPFTCWSLMGPRIGGCAVRQSAEAGGVTFS